MGTPLHELNMKDDNIRSLQSAHDGRYGAMQDLQFEQAHDAQHSLHQAQQNPYYDMPNTGNYPSYNKKNPSPNMEDLAKEISDSLPEDTFGSVSEQDQPTQKNDSDSIMNSIPAFLIDPLIIFILFVLLSVPLVRENIANYVTVIRPSGDGSVAMTGVVAYGIILALLFAIVKKLLS
jgi:hypothetical protein